MIKTIDYGVGSSAHNCGTTTEQYWTQTFNAIASIITSVVVKVNTANATANFTLDLFANDGTGKPTGSAIKSVSIAKAALNNDAETTLAFTTTGLAVGTSYVLRFGDADLGSDDRYGVYMDDAGSIPSGQKSWRYNGSIWEDVTTIIKHIYVKIISNVSDGNAQYLEV